MVTSVLSQSLPSSASTTPGSNQQATSSQNITDNLVSGASSNARASIVNKLGGGSGIDTTGLAQSLVDAEKAPRASAINKNISKNQAIVSGYAYVKAALADLKNAFDGLKNVSSFNAVSLSSNQTNIFGASATNSAQPGQHSILVASLAQPQRSVSTQTFASPDQGINPALQNLTINGSNVSVGISTPSGVVAAINSSGKGLNAQIIQTGETTYKIIVASDTGTSNAFTITGDGGAVDFGTPLQTAADALIQIDGITVTSKSNTITSAIAGVSLTLTGTNATVATVNGNQIITANQNGPSTLSLTNDTSMAKSALSALVSAYNAANAAINDVTDPKSSLPTYGGTLAGNSSVRAIRDQMRALVTMDSSTAGGLNGTGPAHSLSALRDIGIEIDKTGNLTTNSVKMDMALMFKFSDTITLMTGNQENQASFDTASSGLAGDASKKLDSILGAQGTLSAETTNANDRITKFQDDLTALNDRMARLLERYQKQFAAMDSIVGQTKSTQTGLTSTFAGLMAMYTNK